jgi:selenocysteine lyase/cysteine desulfurase
LHLAKRRGIEIDVAPSDPSGQIDVSRLDALLRPSTKVINLVHVPTGGGLVNPAEEVGRFAEQHGLTYFLDACQSVGQIDLDVSRIGCHVLTGTGRKFLRGPRGTGFLYVSNKILNDLEPPFIDMHAATWVDASTYELAAGARRFENWESYIAGRVGLTAAVDYAREIGVPAIEERVTHIANQLRTSLSEIDGVNVRDLGASKCGIVTFDIERESPTDLMYRLRDSGVNISVVGPESAQLDFADRDISELARASVHYINTETEIERFCELLAH